MSIAPIQWSIEARSFVLLRRAFPSRSSPSMGLLSRESVATVLRPIRTAPLDLTQYVQMVNEAFQVFDKATGDSILGPNSIGSLWSGFGGACQNGGAGDPVVLYDQLADRWVISQFASATGSAPITDECVAVSTTGDATGTYNRYGFHLGSNFYRLPASRHLARCLLHEYERLHTDGTTYLGPQPFALDRTAMLAGLARHFH